MSGSSRLQINLKHGKICVGIAEGRFDFGLAENTDLIITAQAQVGL